MRGVRFAMAAALLCVLGGCGSHGPQFSDEQVATWEAQGTRRIPGASEVSVRTDSLVCMWECGTKVEITVDFATFLDMAASAQAVSDFEHMVGEQATGALVTTSVVNNDAENHNAQIAARLEGDIPGVVSAIVLNDNYWVSEGSAGMSGGYVRVFVDDVSVITPQWLDEVATTAQGGFAEVNGLIDSISIFPSNSLGPHVSESESRESRIRVAELDAFTSVGRSGDCVRTASWAYDVSGAVIDVYPAQRPGGICAG